MRESTDDTSPMSTTPYTGTRSATSEAVEQLFTVWFFEMGPMARLVGRQICGSCLSWRTECALPDDALPFRVRYFVE